MSDDPVGSTADGRYEAFRALVRSRFAKDLGSLWSAQAITAALIAAQGILLARWLGPHDYGVVALVVGVPGLVYTFFDARSGDASVKFLGEFESRSERARALAMCKVGFFVDLAVGIASLIVIAGASGWIEAHVVKSPDTRVLLVLYASSLVVRSFAGTSEAILLTLGRIPRLGRIRIAATCARLATVFGCYWMVGGVRGVVIGTALGTGLEGLAFAAGAIPLAQRHWHGAILRTPLSLLSSMRRGIARFVIYSDLSSLVGLFSKQSDILILGYVAAPTQVGFLRLGKAVAGLVGNVVDPLQAVVFPRLARLWASGGWSDVRPATRRYNRSLGLPLAGAVVVTIPVIPWVVRTLAGVSYEPAASVAQLLLAGAAAWLACFWVRPALLSAGDVRFWMLNSGWVVIASLIGFLVAAPRWGADGIAVVQFAIAGIGGHAVAVSRVVLLARRESLGRAPAAVPT